jgi:hypothetical protein
MHGDSYKECTCEENDVEKIASLLFRAYGFTREWKQLGEASQVVFISMARILLKEYTLIPKTNVEK